MPLVAIIGRPNVGKSTLFNRLAGKQLAIVDDRPGVTRDWREAEGHLFEREFRIIDTAGLEESFDDSIQGRMRKQTESALKQTDVVLFVVDGREGITPSDEHFAGWLRRQNKPVILVVNKCENEKITGGALGEAYALGLGDPVPVSAAHGIGLDDLYHVLTPYFPEEETTDPDDGEAWTDDEFDDLDAIEGDEDFEMEPGEEDAPEIPIKIAIVGRPNVGKSTLLNSIVNDQRVMTGPEAGITRDSIAVDWTFEGRAFKLVDTAGMRRRAKVQDAIEKMSVEDSLRAIRLAQVVVLVLDGNAIFDKQDLQIADHVIEEGRALVIAINKWDAVKDKKTAMETFEDKMQYSLAQIKDVRFATISALNNKNIDQLLAAVMETYALWNKRIPTGGLNRWLRAMESRNPAPLVGGRPNRVKYIAQVKTRPPTFALWASKPGDLPDSYKRYITNGLREDFGLPAVPIRLLIRASKNPFTQS
ncbi:MAG TPA: ribosome biogenesis GTPase Der [Rhodospirillaceae bacterium]|nr:ribosome biogenesis GTPase Der [Rhodospirillaceae bacterium]